MKHICPLCGYDGLKEAAYYADPSTDAIGSEIMCPCCAFQFGYHDDNLRITFAEWRGQWIAEGMQWRCDNKPKHYNPVVQLERVDTMLVRYRWWEDPKWQGPT